MPLPGYDLTLLLTHRHLERYSREGLVDFICQVGRGGGAGWGSAGRVGVCGIDEHRRLLAGV